MKKILAMLFLIAIATQARAQVKLLSIDELETRLSQGKDTVYVVNFWATWCGPCIEELPHFEKLQQTYKKQPVKVLLISTDFKSKLETSVKPFVKKHKLQNEVFLLNEKNQQVYIDRISKDWSGALPATLIINRKKQLRKLYEKEFTYKELEQTYLNHK
ncbi:MAG TPA: TlpA disulfide reductase family protein [Sphingobacteriaceae bacterium]